MAKKPEKAESKVSASKIPVKRIIDDLTGIRSGDDVIPCPLDGNPIDITPGLSSEEAEVLIKEAIPPSTIIHNEKKDDIQKGIDIIKGLSQ